MVAELGLWPQTQIHSGRSIKPSSLRKFAKDAELAFPIKVETPQSICLKLLTLESMLQTCRGFLAGEHSECKDAGCKACKQAASADGATGAKQKGMCKRLVPGGERYHVRFSCSFKTNHQASGLRTSVAGMGMFGLW